MNVLPFPLRRVFIGTLGLLLVASHISAQDVTLSMGDPDDVGMSPAILDAGVDLYREAIADGHLVGAVLLVAKDGKVVLHEALGWRNKGRDLPMETNTMFRMASNTKPPVATAISMLVEDGKLEYDDPVRDHIPLFRQLSIGVHPDQTPPQPHQRVPHPHPLPSAVHGGFSGAPGRPHAPTGGREVRRRGRRSSPR